MNTSEFAKLCGVEKRTLFHYDAIGLLQPSRVRENGYREYTMDQLGMMDMIKIFQACGYTLSEIKCMLCEDENSKYTHVQDALERIDARIEQLQQMKTYLHSKQRLLEEYYSLPAGTCQIQALSIRYERKEIAPDRHFFSFLRDGTFSSFLLDDNGKSYICRASETGEHCRNGIAISFFMNIPTGEGDLAPIISEQLDHFGFHGDSKYYVESLPHFLLDDQQNAVLKVTVFEKQGPCNA